MCCVYERVSEHEPRPCSVDWLCSLKGKKGEQGCRERGEDGECDKEQRGETEDSYALWMRSSGWLWGRSLTPPSAPHSTPLSLPSSPSANDTMAFCALMGQTYTVGHSCQFTENRTHKRCLWSKLNLMQSVLTYCIYHVGHCISCMYNAKWIVLIATEWSVYANKQRSTRLLHSQLSFDCGNMIVNFEEWLHNHIFIFSQEKLLVYSFTR